MTVMTPTRDRLLQIAQHLPASPQILGQLGQLLLDVNSSLDDVARLLRRDASLAARIIRISNSAVYGSSGGIASIEEAVNRVGFAEVYRLTGFAAAAQMAELNLPFYGFTGPQLRDNTLVTALAVEALAKRAGVDPRIGYTAGLMRSTGKLVLDRYAKASLPSNESYTRSGLGNLLAWEQSFFGLTNVEAAALVLGAWRFPEAIVAPVVAHYGQVEAPEEYARTATLLNLACGVACDAGYSLPGESTCWELSTAKLRSVSLVEAHLHESRDEALEVFDSLKTHL